MPQIPLLIPIIVTGLLVGSIMVHEGHKISKKRLGTVSVVSGVLNGAQAYLVNYLMPASTSRAGGAFIGAGGGTFTGGGTLPSAAVTAAAAAARQTTALTYYISSILVGILIPLVILGIGLFRARSKGSDEEVEPEEVEPEDSTLEK
jgi:hypothetical protein